MLRNLSLNDMVFELHPVIKEYLLEAVSDFVALDKALYEELGIRYDKNFWTESNFLKDLPKKWEYSFMALGTIDRRLCGFLIASEMLPQEIHIHRLAVASGCRSKGIGASLIEKIFSMALREHAQRITVETNRQNEAAVVFYRKYGFSLLAGDRLKEYASRRKFHTEIFDDFTREKDGCEYYIFERVI